MKITKRQLRRIIREAAGDLDWSNRPGGYDDPAYWADAAKKPMDDITQGRVYDEIVGFLQKGPSAAGRGGMDIATAIIKVRIPNVDSNDVFDLLDEMLEDGVVVFNVEEDEWSLAEDTHEWTEEDEHQYAAGRPWEHN